VYTDAEFALILRKAAELANSNGPRSSSPGGLTLAEMKAAASEAGIDPALVERAARILSATSSKTLYERLIGGPVRHGSEMRLPVKLDEAQATQLLAAVQILAAQPGSGHSSSAGMIWHAQNEMETLRITAQPAEGGTTVAVHVDRTGVLAFIHVASVVGSIAVAAGGVALGDQIAPVVGAAAGFAGIGGILALGRAYWKSSTRQIRKQINQLMDAIGEAAVRPPGLHAPNEVGDESKSAGD
jgi:hypothetical protein